MDKRELAYIKQTLFTVRDWDGFQSVIRTLARLQRITFTIEEGAVKKH